MSSTPMDGCIHPQNDYHDCILDITKPTLLQLNDDCLNHICQKLELLDRVRFARVCQRFQNIFQKHSLLKYKTFRIDKTLGAKTLSEIKEILEEVGPNVVKLNIYMPAVIREEVFHYIGQFLNNLCGIDLCSVKIERDESNKRNNNCEFEKFEQTLMDFDLLPLMRLEKLESLCLMSSPKITGKYLSQLSDLTELSLTACHGIQPANLVEIFKSLKLLRSLDISECILLYTRKDTTLVYRALKNHCKKLESLKLSWRDKCRSERVLRLPMLRKLTVHNITAAGEKQLFPALVQHKAHQLEFLQLDSYGCITAESTVMISHLRKLKQLWCGFNLELSDECLRIFSELENLESFATSCSPSISNAGLLVLLSKCLKLNDICVECSPGITEAFVFAAIEELRRRPQKPKKPFELEIGLAGMDEEAILNNAQYLAGTSVFKLNFWYYPN